MKRMMLNTNRIAVLAFAALLAVAALLGWSLDQGQPTASAQSGRSESVQVRAQLLESGRIEFSLRTRTGDLSPRQRLFPVGTRETGWLVSTPVELPNGAEVLIIARRQADRDVEFGVRTLDPREDYLPRGRVFPASTPVGRRLISTPVRIPAPPAQDDAQQQADEPQPQPEPTPEPEPESSTDDEGDSDETTESVERISGGHRDGLIVENGVLGDPDAPVLISEYGDPF